MLEALKRLEADGLVEIIPQVGCRVVRPTKGAVDELLAVRGALEGLAAASAAREIDDESLAELEVILRQLERAATSGDRAAYEELDQRFHLRVVEASGMPRLIETARTVWATLRYQVARLRITDEQLLRSLPELQELYEALRRHASRRAQAAAERHVKLFTARIAAQLTTEVMTHRALIYAGDEDFLATTLPFVTDGLQADERVLAVTTAHNRELLANALGTQAQEVEFRDSTEWYQLPSHTLLSYQRYLEQADRSRVRLIGEVAWDGESSAPMSEWTRYESILNVAFASDAVSIVCPYDARALPEPILADARRTHPQLCAGTEISPSPEYTDVAELARELDREALPEPGGPTAEQPVTSDLRNVREFILNQGRLAGVSGKRLQDAFLAVQEIAANVLVHGPGQGTIRSWIDDGALVYEVCDRGTGSADPLAGQYISDPALMSEAAGLWLARLLCDLVELRSRDGEFIVRLHVSLH